jgi:hypothetical protein
MRTSGVALPPIRKGDYGGRGITMWDRWLHSVEAFVEDMGRKPTPAQELDREDNDKGYEPAAGGCFALFKAVSVAAITIWLPAARR